MSGGHSLGAQLPSKNESYQWDYRCLLSPAPTPLFAITLTGILYNNEGFQLKELQDLFLLFFFVPTLREIVIPSEIRQRHISYDITYMWNLTVE